MFMAGPCDFWELVLLSVARAADLFTAADGVLGGVLGQPACILYAACCRFKSLFVFFIVCPLVLSSAFNIMFDLSSMYTA